MKIALNMLSNGLVHQMAGYRREELLEEEPDSGHIVFNSSLTSIGNPHFSSSRQLVLDDSQQVEEISGAQELVERAPGSSGPQENFSISFITSNTYERKRFCNRMTPFEKLLFLVIVLLTLVIFTLAITLLSQPSPLLQVHLTKERNGKPFFV